MNIDQVSTKTENLKLDDFIINKEDDDDNI